MSLQALNEEFQLELMETNHPHRHKQGGMKAAMSKLKFDNVGSLFKREYPDTKRLEELLLDF